MLSCRLTVVQFTKTSFCNSLFGNILQEAVFWNKASLTNWSDSCISGINCTTSQAENDVQQTTLLSLSIINSIDCKIPQKVMDSLSLVAIYRAIQSVPDIAQKVFLLY